MQFNCNVTPTASVQIATLIFVSLGIYSINAEASCGGAFCSLNTYIGVQGSWNTPGVRLDVLKLFSLNKHVKK